MGCPGEKNIYLKSNLLSKTLIERFFSAPPGTSTVIYVILPILVDGGNSCEILKSLANMFEKFKWTFKCIGKTRILGCVRGNCCIYTVFIHFKWQDVIECEGLSDARIDQLKGCSPESCLSWLRPHEGCPKQDLFSLEYCTCALMLRLSCKF